MPSLAALRHAPWSASKVKCALRCPKEFHYKYVERIPERAVEADARIGKAVHAALEGALEGVEAPPEDARVESALASGRKALLGPDEEARYDVLAGGVRDFTRRVAGLWARRRIRNVFVEHKLAVTADLEPTGFMMPDAFFRGVIDLGFRYDETLAVIDHKTGMRHALDVFSDQLDGYALLSVANMGHARRVWLGLHFVGQSALDWCPPLGADAIRTDVTPRVIAQIEEAAVAVGGPAVPRPSGWCARCSYRSICPSVREAAAAASAALESAAAALEAAEARAVDDVG